MGKDSTGETARWEMSGREFRGHHIPDVWPESQQTEPRAQELHVWGKGDWCPWVAVEAEAEESGGKEG